MSCNSCGHIIANCTCDNTPSINCCDGEDKFIAETPNSGPRKKYPHDVQNADIINSELSLDCNTPSDTCNPTQFESTGVTRCQEIGGNKTGKLETLNSRIDENCQQIFAWFDSGVSSQCTPAVRVKISDVSCGVPVMIEISGFGCE